ncbi:MAG: hypothetical protein MJ066_05485 [Clostridia bacterium]|nr:hypothetical protein [Clostridia bacterium]
MKDNNFYKSVKDNRTTTLESLEAFVLVLLAQDQKTFCEAYEKATHDKNGASIWYYMQNGRRL